MPQITAIGETVLDIVIKDGNPLVANPGGSVLNSIISLSRLGADTRFITEFGKDAPGMQVKKFLHNNGVDTSCVCEYPNHQTAVALAYLDEANNASYTFYKDYPSLRLAIPMPSFDAGGYFLYASSMAINEQVRPVIVALAKQAEISGCTVYYDPNCRPKAGQDGEHQKSLMLENMGLSHIVRGSSEDFEYLFGHCSLSDIWETINSPKLKMLICTHGADGVSIMRGGESFSYSVPQIIPISTVGAGDNFNAGFLFSLANQSIGHSQLSQLDENTLRQICDTATACSANVCCSLDNYISTEFARSIQNSQRK